MRPRVAYAVAALEIVDSRIADWDITFADTVADNGSSGLFVLGADRVPLDAVEPAAVQMTMFGERCARVDRLGRGVPRRPAGRPRLARADRSWPTATRCAPATIVLSGALGPMVRVDQAMHVRADLTGLGSVEATFTTPVTKGGS